MLTGCLGGVVDYRSPHQKRAATHAYDRSGTAAFSWVSVGVRWPRHTVSRWGPRGGFPDIAHPSVVRCVCAAYPGQKSGGACLCRTVRGGVVDQGANGRRKLLNAGLCGGVVGSAPHPQNTPQKSTSKPSSNTGFRPTAKPYCTVMICPT